MTRTACHLPANSRRRIPDRTDVAVVPAGPWASETHGSPPRAGRLDFAVEDDGFRVMRIVVRRHRTRGLVLMPAPPSKHRLQGLKRSCENVAVELAQPFDETCAVAGPQLVQHQVSVPVPKPTCNAKRIRMSSSRQRCHDERIGRTTIRSGSARMAGRSSIRYGVSTKANRCG